MALQDSIASMELFSMNLSTMILSLVICVAVFIVAYLVYAVGIREKSFEEVIAEQRRQQIEEEKQQKQEKTKKDKEKKHKKWGKKGKEKPEQQVVEKVVEPEPLEEPIPEIEIIEPKEIVVPKKKSKGTSANKANTTPPTNPLKVTNAKTSTENATTAEHGDKKKSKSGANAAKTNEKPKEEIKATEAPKSKPIEVEKATVASVPIQAVPVATPSVASKKKKKAEQSDKIPTDMNITSVNKLVSLIKEAALDDDDSRMIIDILLNKQKDAAGWKKQTKEKQEKMERDLKRQQQEKDQAYEFEKKQHQDIVQKLKQDLNQERSKSTKFNEKVASQQQELQAVNLRLKEKQEQLKTETLASQEKLKQMEKISEEKTDVVKKLKDENDQLMKSVKRLETESKNSAEFDKMKKSRDDIQKVHALLVEQHTLLNSSSKKEIVALNAKVTTTEEQLSSLKTKYQDLEAAKKTFDQKSTDDSSKTEVSQLTKSLEDAKKRSEELLREVDGLNKQVAELTKANNKLQLEIENFKQNSERGTGDGQEVNQHNGEMNGREKPLEQNFIENHEKILKEKDTVMKQLYDDLSTYKSKVKSVSDELELQKGKNDELREKNWKVAEALAAMEKSTQQSLAEAERKADEKLKQVQSESAEQLRLAQKESETKASGELSGRLNQAESRLTELQKVHDAQSKEHREQLGKSAQLSTEVQQLRDLRTSLESRLTESSQKAEELKVQINVAESSCRSCLQRIFPKVNPDNSLPHDEWLSAFEKAALNEIEQSSDSQGTVTELQARFADLEIENDNLQSKLAQYEGVLADTEATLNRLQDSAKSQEAEWVIQLEQKGRELESALQKSESLEKSVSDSNNEKSNLQQKFDEANQNYLNLMHQIETKESAIADLQKEVASFDNLKKDLERLKTDLEKEKKINKDFSSQMVRLNSLVKIGQESLALEQENVKKLQAQLDAAMTAKANGTSSPAISETESQAKLVKVEKPKKSKKLDASGKK